MTAWLQHAQTLCRPFQGEGLECAHAFRCEVVLTSFGCDGSVSAIRAAGIVLRWHVRPIRGASLDVSAIPCCPHEANAVGRIGDDAVHAAISKRA
ncbi:hypothetical protein D3C76_830360 [compost metagenome]